MQPPTVTLHYSKVRCRYTAVFFRVHYKNRRTISSKVAVTWEWGRISFLLIFFTTRFVSSDVRHLTKNRLLKMTLLKWCRRVATTKTSKAMRTCSALQYNHFPGLSLFPPLRRVSPLETMTPAVRNVKKCCWTNKINAWCTIKLLKFQVETFLIKILSRQ